MSKWTWKDNVLWMDDVGIEMKSEVDAAAVATTHNSTEPFDLCSEGHVITPEESRCQFGHPRRVTPTTQKIAAEAAVATVAEWLHEFKSDPKEANPKFVQSAILKATEELQEQLDCANEVITKYAGEEAETLRAAHASEKDDTKRLDWLDANWDEAPSVIRESQFESVREAIDAAMKE